MTQIIAGVVVNAINAVTGVVLFLTITSMNHASYAPLTWVDRAMPLVALSLTVLSVPMLAFWIARACGWKP